MYIRCYSLNVFLLAANWNTLSVKVLTQQLYKHAYENMGKLNKTYNVHLNKTMA